MRFQIDRPAYVSDQYIEARVQEPKILEFKPDVDVNNISRNWKPLDAEAVEALAKLGKKAAVVAPSTAASVKQDVQTMSEAQSGKKAQRGSSDAIARVSPLPAGVSADGLVVSSAK